MLKQTRTVISVTAVTLLASGLIASEPARSDDAGYFIGGMLTSKLMSNMQRRTQAEEAQAYSQPQQVQQVQAAPTPAPLTPEQRIAQLDKLAAGGYITPAEYQQKKQAIINSM